VALSGGRPAGTVTLYPPGREADCEYYRRPGVAVFGQFAVEPELQGRGIGRLLLERVERRAAEIGATEIALDTAEGAAHLIEMYRRHGYAVVGAADWEVTNYKSVIMAKQTER
jgi:GNAT superfamily N-acetyltransferase